MKRRVMDIEDALRWAFRDELPKGYRTGGAADNVGYPSMSPMFSMVATGGRIDNWSREPGFPAAMGEPHPDALLIAAAVERLERFAAQEVEGDVGLMPDLAAFAVDEVAAMKRALPRAASIVITAAKSGRRPFFTTKPPVFRPVRFDNGNPTIMAWQTQSRPKPAKMGGGTVEWDELLPVRTLKNGGYPTGSHCVLTYSPDPKEIAEERADYAVWWAALNAIAEDLTGELSTIAVLPPSAAQRPWSDEQDAAKPPKIFADLSGRVYQQQQRETAAAYRQLGQRRQVGARTTGAYRVAPRRTHIAEAATG